MADVLNFATEAARRRPQDYCEAWADMVERRVLAGAFASVEALDRFVEDPAHINIYLELQAIDEARAKQLSAALRHLRGVLLSREGGGRR
jgi:hypothetical protein